MRTQHADHETVSYKPSQIVKQRPQPQQVQKSFDTEINDNYVSEYTQQHAMANSSMQEHHPPLEIHGQQTMNSVRGGRDESPPLSKEQVSVIR